VSLTSGWSTTAFELRSLPLECSEFGGSHTGERVLEKLKAMLARNGISEDRVTAYVIDNGANMQKAGRLAKFDCISCAPHTLQLTINKVIEADDAFDALRAASKVVGAFKHSALRCEQLEQAQTVSNGKPKRLVQRVSTRWSSSLAMIKSLLASKVPVELILDKMRKESTAAAKATAAPTVATATSTASTVTPAAAAAAASSDTSTAASAASARTPSAAAVAETARLAAYGADYEGVVKRTRTSLGAVKVIQYAESDGYSSSDDGSVDYGEPRASEVEDSGSDSDDEVEVTQVVRGRGRSSTQGSGSKSSSSKGKGTSTGKGKTKAASASETVGGKVNYSSGSGSNSSKAQQSAKRKSAAAKARKPPHLTAAQWELFETLSKLLEPFAAVQRALEGEQYITSIWLPYHIAKLREHLESCAAGIDAAVSKAASEMLVDFIERWGEWPKAVLLCAALDPRTKKLKFFDSAKREEVWQLVLDEMKVVQEAQQQRRAAAQKAVVDAAAAASGEKASEDTTAGEQSVNDDKQNVDRDSMLDDSDSDSEGDGSGNESSSDISDVNAAALRVAELKCFRDLARLSGSTANPLTWWKDRAERYPLVAAVARKWLAVPASSAASERMFSSAGLTVTDKRTRLTGDKVAQLVFLKTAWPTLQKMGILY
jgi:hAT family C-terminal dimerisation region